MQDRRSLLPRPIAGLLGGLLAAALLVYLFTRLQPLRPRAGASGVLLSDVTVVDPISGAESPGQDILWQDGQILAVGPSGSLASDGARRRLGHGAWALPAAADAAVFLSLEGRLPGDSVPAEAAQSLRLQALAGVGLVLDLNAHRNFMDQARRLGGPRPRALFAGALFTSPGGWRLSGQTPWNSHVVEVTEPEDLDAPWQQALRFHDQAVFASVDHDGRDDLPIPPAALIALGRLAHQQGLPFIIHVRDHRRALESLQARPDALLGPLLDAGDDVLLGRNLRALHCAYIPALGSVLNALPGGPPMDSLPLARDLEPGLLAAETDPDHSAAFVRQYTRRGLDLGVILAVPVALAANGADLALGTGSGLPLVFHGLGWQAELGWLKRAGLQPGQILAALARSRVLLGAGNGRLEAGQPADILLLGSDPMQSSDALLKPFWLVVAGQGLKP